MHHLWCSPGIQSLACSTLILGEDLPGWYCWAPDLGISIPDCSGPEKGVITKGVISLEESLESLKSRNSLESLENGWLLLYFPESGGSLKSLESLENELF